MSSKDRYMITKIRDTKYDNVSLSIDENMDKDEFEVAMVMLYTPDMNNTMDHYHVTFDRERVIALRDWCNDFLSEPDLKKRFEEDLARGKEKKEEKGTDTDS